MSPKKIITEKSIFSDENVTYATQNGKKRGRRRRMTNYEHDEPLFSVSHVATLSKEQSMPIFGPFHPLLPRSSLLFLSASGKSAHCCANAHAHLFGACAVTQLTHAYERRRRSVNRVRNTRGRGDDRVTVAKMRTC